MKFITVAILVFIIYYIFKYSKKEKNILKEIMSRAVKNEGSITAKDIKRTSDPHKTRKVLNKMYERGIATIVISDSKSAGYHFISLPSDYSPFRISDADEFTEEVINIAANDPDGQVFGSQIAASFDIQPEDLFELMDHISENEQLKVHRAKNGNLYFIFTNQEEDGI